MKYHVVSFPESARGIERTPPSGTPLTFVNWTDTTTVVDGSDWTNGQHRGVRDATTGDLIVAFYNSSGAIQFWTSQNSGASFSLVSTVTITPDILMGLAIDSNGKLHGISTRLFNHTWYYTRFAVTRSGGHVTAVSIDQSPVQLPDHSPDASNADPRGDIIIGYLNGVEVPIWAYEYPASGTINIVGGYINGITGTTSSVGFGGSGNDTTMFTATATGQMSAHYVQLYLCQEFTSEAVFLMYGQFNGDYYLLSQSSSTQFDTSVKRFARIGSFWSTSPSTTVIATNTPSGGNISYPLQAMSATGKAVMMYYEGSTGKVKLGYFDTSGTWHDAYINEVTTAANKAAFGGASCNADASKIWTVLKFWGANGASPSGLSGFYDGSWHTQNENTVVDGTGAESMGTIAWSEGCLGMWGFGSTLAQTQSKKFIGGVYGVAA